MVNNVGVFFQRKDLSFTDIGEKLADTVEQLETAMVAPGRFYRMRDDVITRMEAAGITLKNPMDEEAYKRNVRKLCNLLPCYVKGLERWLFILKK
jgi:hypothetical protein